ncbi:MAG: GDSL-type esterase/lipase family protein [Candidatus Lernaella stagnicola]|nr:GDSL-type esterase/lipase family protein [Candidatus Lernaella stagnicola]
MTANKPHHRAEWRPLAALFVVNVLLVGLPFLVPDNPGGDWYKGPLVDPVSPYSTAGGVRMLGACLAALLDLTALFVFGGFALLRNRLRDRRWLMPVIGLAAVGLALTSVELGLRAYLNANVKTMFLPDPVLNWRLVPNLKDFHNTVGGEYVTTNSLGWRAPEPPPNRAADEVRGLLLGDSSAYGLGVAEPETMARALERGLTAAMPGKRVTIYNAACPGHTTHQGLKLLREHTERLQPDLVVIAYNNDPALEFHTDREREAAGGAQGMQRLLYRSRLFIVLRQVLVGLWRGQALDWEDPGEVHRRAVEGKRMKHRVPLDEYEDNLRRMIEFAREKRFTLVFVRMPVNREMEHFIPRFYDERYPQALLALDRDGAAVVVDVDVRWEADGVVDFLPGHLFHPNAVGHALIARDVLGRLRQVGFVAGDVRTALPLRLGYSAITPLHTLIGEVLRRTDIARKHGLDASFRVFERGSDQADAAPELDGTFTTELPAVLFLTARPRWRIVGCTGGLGRIGLVAATPDVKQIGQLRGGKIGVPFESTPHADLTRWLAAAGLSAPRDVALVNLGMRDHRQALAERQVSAVATWDPWLTALAREGGRSEVVSRPFYSLLVLTESWLVRHPQGRERYLAAVRDALLYARGHREEVLGWVVERSGLSEPVVAALWEASGRRTGEIDFAVPPEAEESLARMLAFFRQVSVPEIENDEPWLRLRGQMEATRRD